MLWTSVDGLQAFTLSKNFEEERLNNNKREHFYGFWYLLKMKSEKIYPYSSYKRYSATILNARRNKNALRELTGLHALVQYEHFYNMTVDNSVKSTLCGFTVQLKKLVKEGNKIIIQDGDSVELLLDYNYRITKRTVDDESLLQ